MSDRKLSLYIREYYTETNWKKAVEINLNDFPELDGMDEDDAYEYISENSYDMFLEDGTSLYDLLNDQDICNNDVTCEGEILLDE